MCIGDDIRGLVLEGDNLVVGDLLVLVDGVLEDTTRPLVVGVVLVAQLEDAGHLGSVLGVDTSLLSLVGVHVGSDLVDVTDEAVLDLGQVAAGLKHIGDHHLLGVTYSIGGLLLGCGDVLDGLCEANILEGSSSGKLLVQVGGGSGQLILGVLGVFSHLDVGTSELLVSTLSGSSNAVLDSCDGSVVTGDRGSIGSSELIVSGFLGGLEGSSEVSLVASSLPQPSWHLRS